MQSWVSMDRRYRDETECTKWLRQELIDSAVLSCWTLRLFILLALFVPLSSSAGIFGIEFDEDDCIEKYSDKMRWAKQRRLMTDICYVKHGSGSQTEKRFAQCVLDSILEVSDDSNGRRVLQSCSSKTGDQATFRRFVNRFPMQPDQAEILRQLQEESRSEARHPKSITIIGPNGPRPCMLIGEILHCP